MISIYLVSLLKFFWPTVRCSRLGKANSWWRLSWCWSRSWWSWWWWWWWWWGWWWPEAGGVEGSYLTSQPASQTWKSTFDQRVLCPGNPPKDLVSIIVKECYMYTVLSVSQAIEKRKIKEKLRGGKTIKIVRFYYVVNQRRCCCEVRGKKNFNSLWHSVKLTRVYFLRYF